jgi:ribosome-associated toxin RatA of RatAB toxin-antitoxin module
MENIPNVQNNQPTAYMAAELEVGFPPFVEKYVSDIIVRDGTYVRANAQKNGRLFTHLGNIWELKPGPTPNTCILTFHVDFGFASSWYQKVADMFFNFRKWLFWY